jgi:hypothetical protein
VCPSCSYFGDAQFGEGGQVRETQQQGVAATALARITAAYGCTRPVVGQPLVGSGCDRVKLLLLSIQQPTTGALTAVTTESQTEAGTVSTFYSPFDPMLHVDDLIVSAMSSFTNATIPLAGQDFALCETHGCPAGTFMVSDCGGADGLSDRECQLYQSCTSIEYEAAPGNATHDRDCRPITFCAERGFQLTPPTASSNRQCAQFTQCTDLGAPCPRSGTPSELRAEGCGDHPSDEYEVAPSTLTSDVVCQIYQQCNFTEHEVLGSSECVSIACASLCRASALCLGIALDA